MDYGIFASSTDSTKLGVTAQAVLGLIATQVTLFLVNHGYTIGQQDVFSSLAEITIAFGLLRKVLVMFLRIKQSSGVVAPVATPAV